MIIGIIGKKRHGKDEIGKILCKEFEFTRYGFADPMKEACREIFLWDDRHLYGELKEEIDWRWGISPRQVLQHIGTEWGQLGLCESFDEFKNVTGRKLWVNRFKYWYDNNKETNPNVVLTDVRFPHEVEVLKEIGGKLIKVIRPNFGNKDSHESEGYIDNLPFDECIINSKDLEYLKILTRETFKNLKENI